MTTDQVQREMQDLPELNTLTVGGKGQHIAAFIAWLCFSALLGAATAVATDFVVNLFLNYWLGIPVCVAIGVCVGLAAAAWLTRDKLFDWRWVLDAEGITVNGLFAQRHIGWREVTEVVPKHTSIGKLYTLRTTKGKITLSDLVQKSGDLTGAVLFQHLRRYGKADESILTAGGRTYWIPIPDTVPSEMDWHHPNPPNWSILMAATAVIAVAFVVAFLIGHRPGLGSVFGFFQHWGMVLVGWVYKSLRDRLIMARTVAVRQDQIQIRTARRTLYLRWSDIGYVSWDVAHKSMAIGRNQFKDVAVIPYLEKDPDSAACLLTIIRHLRLARHYPPVAIPITLLPVLYAGAAVPMQAFSSVGPAAVAFDNGLAGLVPVLLSLIPVALICWKLSDFSHSDQPMRWMLLIVAAPVAGAIVGICGVFLTRLTLRADATGITVKRGFQRRFVDWREIASYVVIPTRGGQNKRVLADSYGKAILTIPPMNEAQPNAERFITLLDAHLAHVRQSQLPTLTR